MSTDANTPDESQPKRVVFAPGCPGIKTPPLGTQARREAGFLIRALQDGESLGLPRSRPMPDIGPRCHELRIDDTNRSWRIFCRTDETAVVIIDVEEKRTQRTPKRTIDRCIARLARYDNPE